ncbi:MAG: hypothetical protein NZ895_06520 [Archaeoglobaceae archaeon]|nr:hypothetical protein [Archaeoglobaceae archaeon]MCX8152291.1 hypothetical protein [Archaeoglobaceae archaeon]MDW8013969.1 hypothetical protein [Archaeoglobaceae archaeon]
MVTTDVSLPERELLELFKEAPKESFELLLRNLRIRDYLQNLYYKHSLGLKLFYDENFDRIFDEFFKFFFRPLELAVYGIRSLRFLFYSFDVEFLETQNEVSRALNDFIISWFEHLKLTSEIFLGRTVTGPSDLLRYFIKMYKERFERIPRVDLSPDYPFIFPKSVFEKIEKSTEHWQKFSDDFLKYKGTIKETYVKAAEKFIEVANSKTFGSYQEFSNTFSEIEAKAFDELLKSKEYLDLQKNMLENLMDYIYYYRSFLEELLISNPVNPFATISMIDEAFKRITDLKRRVSELEKKVLELEGKYAGRKD